MSSQLEFSLNRIRWGCRRGMLELDIILLPFLEKHFSKLSQKQQANFIQLLEYPDPELYNWLMSKDIPKNLEQPELTEIIELIKVNTAYVKQPS